MKHLLLLFLCLPLTMGQFLPGGSEQLFDDGVDGRPSVDIHDSSDSGSGIPTPADKDDFEEMWNQGDGGRRAVCSQRSYATLTLAQKERCDIWLNAPTSTVALDGSTTDSPVVTQEDKEEIIHTSQAEVEDVRPTPRRIIRPPKPVCIKDKDCGYKKFCHRTYGRCENCMRERQLCRRRGMCCKGMECRYGVCSMPVKTGRLGSRCKADIDCDGDTCCAKSWGRNVCKPRLPKGSLCHPPSGGLLWSLHNHCPCQAGLDCFAQKEFAMYTFFGITIYLPFKIDVSRCRDFTLNTTQPTST